MEPRKKWFCDYPCSNFNFKSVYNFDYIYQYGLKQRLVNEDVLVFGLDHVVPLRAQTGHVTVDVDGLLVLQPLQHRIDHNESSGTTHSGTVKETFKWQN